MSETARRYLAPFDEPEPSAEPDPMLAVLERIAAALEKIAEGMGKGERQTA